MVKTICIIQARLTSTRLPKKVLMPLGLSGKSILEHVYERLSLATSINKIVFAIPNSSRNDELADFLQSKGFTYFRGSEDDVLDRYYQCTIMYNPKIIVRATCDNPFVDYNIADDLIKHFGNNDYLCSEGIPIGTGVEVFTMEALCQSYREATTHPEHEHVTPYIYTHPDRFRFARKNYGQPTYRLTVDEEKDYELANKLYNILYHGTPIPNITVYNYLAIHPELISLNSNIHQKNIKE